MYKETRWLIRAPSVDERGCARDPALRFASAERFLKRVDVRLDESLSTLWVRGAGAMCRGAVVSG